MTTGLYKFTVRQRCFSTFWKELPRSWWWETPYDNRPFWNKHCQSENSYSSFLPSLSTCVPSNTITKMYPESMAFTKFLLSPEKSKDILYILPFFSNDNKCYTIDVPDLSLLYMLIPSMSPKNVFFATNHMKWLWKTVSWKALDLHFFYAVTKNKLTVI